MTVEAAIGLSFLAAETSRAPFRGSFTTVSQRPSAPRTSGSRSTSWSKTFEAAAGYDVPELGFWGFAESLCPSDKVQPAPGSAPVTAAEKGTTLIRFVEGAARVGGDVDMVDAEGDENAEVVKKGKDSSLLAVDD
ncbi:hypothetical protein MY4824_008024 [Beauveria thailandica]